MPVRASRPSALDITEGLRDGCVVLRLRGALDDATAPRLTRRLSVLRGAQQAVVIDVGELRFIDEEGMQVLVGNVRAGAAKAPITITRDCPALNDLAVRLGVASLLPYDESAADTAP